MLRASPQAVVNQKPLWQLLLVLLFLTFILCLLGVDISGALLSGLTLWVACLMLRDGMTELSRYAMCFGMVCCLCLLFDILPLLTEITGRVQSQTQATPTIGPDGQEEIRYTVTTKKTPLFDLKMGFVYNVQSVTLFVSPVAYGLGMYLAMTAHQELQRLHPAFNEDLAEAGIGAMGMRGARGAGPIIPRQPAEDGSLTDARARQEAVGQVQPFQGRAYKLDWPEEAGG